MKSVVQTTLILILLSSQVQSQSSFIDSTFGNNGLVTTQFSSQSGVIDLIEQPNGKILACGDSNLVRYNGDGSIDSTFGNNGVVHGFGFHARTMEIQSDGKILIGGESHPGQTWSSYPTAQCFGGLKRLFPNGQVDSAFGINGFAANAYPHQKSVTDITIHPDGRIFTIGHNQNNQSYSNTGSLIRAYLADGQLDTAFTHQSSWCKIKEDLRIFTCSDSNLLIAGAMHGYAWIGGFEGFSAMKLYPSGIIDSTYGINGRADTANTWFAYDLISELNSDDELIFASEAYNANTYTFFSPFAKFDQFGLVDSTFSATIPLSWGDGTNSIEADGTKAMYVAIKHTNDFKIIKLNEFGNRDSICFEETVVDFDSANDTPSTLIHLSDGRILVGGSSNGHFALVRLDPFPYVSFSDASCESYIFNGQQINSSGIYHDTLQSVNGCDSIVELDLTIYPTQSSELETEACTEFTFNGYSYTNSGNYIDTLQSIHGCDSIVELDLTINSADAQIMQEWDSLVSISTGTAYQWINCQTGTPISGATQATFDPDSNGTYAMILTDNGCSDTSDCIDVFNVGVDEREASNFVIYPNPSNGSFTIQFDQISQSSSLEIYTISGQLIFQTGVQNQQTVPLNLDLSQGMYILQSTVGNRSQRQNLVIH